MRTCNKISKSKPLRVICSNMIHPLLILPIGWVKIRAYLKTGVEYFYGFYFTEHQVTKTGLATRFGKTHRLPAHQYNPVGGGARNTIWMHYPHQRLAMKRNAAGPAAFRSLPQCLCYLFQYTGKYKKHAILKESKHWLAFKSFEQQHFRVLHP